ncbi:MAG TPA: hypothetical protein VNZ44_04555 [Pyrinomonadaceae bacterium]|nr:hypothetical protein [Pyrinomonadaceae bacterium]
MLVYLVIFFAVVSLFLFVHKLVYKRRMERSLGRKVSDRELTSLTSWMDATPEAREKGQTGPPRA